METFLIILSNPETGNIDWQHPNELNGKSKEEIYNLIAQDVPKENIVEILTAEEYDNKYFKGIKTGNINNNVQSNISDMSSEQFENGKDFFNAMLNAGNQLAEKNSMENNEKVTINKPIKNNSKRFNNKDNKDNNIEEYNSEPIKYFEEGGIKFKLENGKLYKKVWKQILLNGQKTPDGDEAVSEFRLVSSTTKKLVSVDKVELQHLDWEEVKTH